MTRELTMPEALVWAASFVAEQGRNDPEFAIVRAYRAVHELRAVPSVPRKFINEAEFAKAQAMYREYMMVFVGAPAVNTVKAKPIAMPVPGPGMSRKGRKS